MTWAAALRQTVHPRQPCHRKPDGRQIVPIFTIMRRHRRQILDYVETSLIWICINIPSGQPTYCFSPTAALEPFLPRSVSAGMKRDKNPNWQDKLLGGAILTGFVVVAVIAVVFTVVTWTSGRHTASSTTAVHPLMRPDRRLIL